MNWKPIETAPKDQEFLAAVKTDEGYTFEVAALTDHGAVQATNDCEPFFCRSWYCEATHWMPLPEPPTP